jgi:hypothetical protein
MLSPNAMNFVNRRSGTGGTNGSSVTLKVHVAVFAGTLESKALHVTGVVPSANSLPGPGVHTLETGPTPPVCAGLNVTACVGVVTSPISMFGHVNSSAVAGGGGQPVPTPFTHVGSVGGDFLHAGRADTHTTTSKSRKIQRKSTTPLL